MTHESEQFEWFGGRHALIGMVHVHALPGTPNARWSVREIAEHASAQAAQYADAGFDALIIENMHDRPYLRRRVGPEIVAAMTFIGQHVQQAVRVPLGVQILAGANSEALAVAHAIDAQFIRAEGFIFASVADEGILEEADAGALLRYRRTIGADAVRVCADIKKKHSSHAITSDVDIAETARAAEFCGADAVIVTGGETADPVDLETLAAAKSAAQGPVMVGSGVTPEQIPHLCPQADAFIVGSFCKQGGDWRNDLDSNRLESMVAAVESVRGERH